MVAGIVLTYMRPYKIGDRIKVGDVTGDVVEKNLLVTRLRTIKNEDITIPNATILSGHTVNYTTMAKTTGLILNTTVTIGYDVPWQTVHHLLISAAEASEGISAEPKPFVLQTELNDFNVSYQLNAYTALSNQMAVIYSRLHQNIQDKFNEAGVEIMSPHYTSLRDGNHIQIPENYVPEGYNKPGFKVEGD
jgi:small-conductance mechanosensitive channel